MCNVYHSRSCGWAGSGRAARLRTWSRMFCTSSTSVPRAASAASSCSCKQRCAASPVGPWAGGARAGLTGAVRGAAAAHAIDAVLLLHHDGSTWYCICLATVAGRGGASAPGGEAGAHARAGLAGQYGVGPRTTATCSASNASSHETMLCVWRARDHGASVHAIYMRQTHAPSAIVKFEFSRPAVLLVRQAAPGLRCLP